MLKSRCLPQDLCGTQKNKGFSKFIMEFFFKGRKSNITPGNDSLAFKNGF